MVRRGARQVTRDGIKCSGDVGGSVGSAAKDGGSVRATPGAVFDNCAIGVSFVGGGVAPVGAPSAE